MLKNDSAITFKNGFFFPLFFTLILSACGGGGSGGSPANSNNPAPGTSTSSSSSSSALKADAGPDTTVNAGETISLDPHAILAAPNSFSMGSGNLKIKGSSVKSTDIVEISWTKISGPQVSLTTHNTTDAKATFVAPSTGTEASIQIVYKLTITTAANETAEDTVTFTIKRVNQAPSVSANSTVAAKGKETVNLIGTASDIDGTIRSYEWKQISGVSVTIINPDAAAANFIAPDVVEKTELGFQLTVTDNDGATNSSPVTASISPADAPEIGFYFPPKTGFYSDNTISASGYAKAINQPVSSVIVSAGNGDVTATLNPDGSWYADNISLPQNTGSVELTARVTDSKGMSEKAISQLSRSYIAGTGSARWNKSLGMGIEHASNTAYLFTTGSLLSDIRILPIDIVTGNRGDEISNFSDSSQGPNASAIMSTAYDENGHRFFYSTSPADKSVEPQILSVDTHTGTRTIVSDSTHGTGPALSTPVGLAIGDDNIIYVANNGDSSILAIDTQTGNRTVVADKNSVAYPITGPEFLAYSAATKQLYEIPHNTTYTYLYKIDLETKMTDLISTDDSFTDVKKGAGDRLFAGFIGIAFDPGLNKVFTLSSSTRLSSIDVNSGDRKAINSSVGVFKSPFAYDEKHHLMYLTDGFRTSFLVCDVRSGNVVTLTSIF